MGGGRVILLAVPASARRTIIAWTLYDFANSAFAAVVLSTVYPAYYANVVVGNADGRGDFWWGAAVSTAMVIGALTSPPLGGIADHAGARWNFFVGFSVVSIAATALMATVGPGRVWWGWVLAVVGIVTYEAAFVYYNSYLPRIAPPERIGRVSAAGFAVGYAGSLVAFAAAYPFAAAHAYGGCFAAAAALFAVFSIPAFVILPADARHPMRLATAATRGVGETLVTLREILRDPARADAALPHRVSRLRGRGEHRGHLRGRVRGQDARLHVHRDHRPLHAGAGHRAARLGGVGAADRLARPALRGWRQPRAVGAGDHRRVFRRHQGPLLGRRDPRRHRPRSRPGREPHVHGHPGAPGPGGRVLRFLLAGGQDGRDLRAPRVGRRVVAAVRQPARRDRLGGALLRRRARAAGPRQRRRADGGRARAPRRRWPVTTQRR